MQKIRIDFDNPGLPQHISAVENDSQSRFFQATLYENGKAYTAPEGAAYSIMYRGFGPQNQGWYDTINDGAGKRAACAVSGNVVTCEIARQALQVPGHVSIVLCVTTGKGYMLKSWPIECDCKNDRYDSTTEIESFFYVTSVSNASWMQAIQAVEELKNTIDPTLSLSGKAADAAKVGEAVNAEAARAKAAEEENAKGVSQLKEDISDFKDTVLSEVSNNLTKTIALSQNKGIDADDPFMDDFPIKNGAVCKLMITGLNGAVIDTFAAVFYYLSSDGSTKKISSVRFGGEYEFISDADAIGIRMYVNAHDVIKDGDFEITVESINKNPKSLQSRIDGISDYIDKTVVVDDIVSATTIFRNSEIKIGANSNNDSGNTTYIFKKIEIPVTKDDCIGIKIASITGAISDSPVRIYCRDSSGKNIKSFTYNEENVKNGVIVTPPTSCVKADIMLYPSTTGGLADTFAIYSNVHIWKSSDGRYAIKKEHIPKNNPPAYYLKDDYMHNKISEIRKLIKKADGNYDAFFFCTDQHWTLNAKKSPLLMRYISERVNIPRAFMGGDYADGINRDAIIAFSSNYNGQIYNTTGNHEFMDYWCEDGAMVPQDITGADIWANLDGQMTDCIIGNAHRNYYYVDNIVQKIRYIILSVFDDGLSSNFDADQHTWLENTALSMPGNYNAVIFAHHIINVDSDYRVSVTEFGADIISIAERNGNVIAMFSGHTHIDGMYKTSGGIPCFVTTCDKFQPWIDNGQNKEPLLSKRVENTITEQAFDVVIADKKNKIISAVRIGCPADNGGKELLEIRQQSYGDPVENRD